MLYSISGKLILKKPQFAVVETSGIGFKVFLSHQAANKLPKIGSKVKFFVSLQVHQDGLELYGFVSEKEREIFDILTSVNGVGAKAAMKILGITKSEQLLAAISQGRSDLLTRASGVGRKKADRIILELQGKVKTEKEEQSIAAMEANTELAAILKELGYKQKEVQNIIAKISPKTEKIEEKLRSALKLLAR